MLAAFAQTIKERKSAPNMPIVLCLEYIEDHLHEKITLNDLAQATNYSPKYLSALFHKEMNQSLKEYILTKKVNLAKDMLRSGDFTILEVSEILAFSSQSYFTKVFIKYEGTTPKKYQDNARLDSLQKNSAGPRD